MTAIVKDILRIWGKDIEILFDVEFEKKKNYINCNTKKFGFRIEVVTDDFAEAKKEFAEELLDTLNWLAKENLLMDHFIAKGFNNQNYKKKIEQIKQAHLEKDIINIIQIGNSSWNSEALQ